MFKLLRVNKVLTKTNYSLSSVLIREKQVWTSDNVVKSPFEDIIVPNTTIYDYVWRNLDKWPTKTAAVCAITKRRYTYEQMYKQSQIFAANLRKKFKIKDGDAVAVMMTNNPEYPIVVTGILAAGGIVTTLNPIYTAYELQRQFLLSDCKVIVALPDVVPTIKEAFKLFKQQLPIIVVNLNQGLPQGTISFTELVEDEYIDVGILKEVNRNADDVAFLPFSSGTSGLPKGVELTNRNGVSNCEQQNTECRLYSYTTATHQDSTLALLPMFHSYGLMVLMLHKMSVGVRLVTLPKFNPDTFLNSLVDYRINLLFLAPPIVLYLGSSSQVAAKHVEHLDCVISGAAPLPIPDKENFRNKLRADTHFGEGYGLTETSPLATMCPKGYQNLRSVGFPIPNVELRIVDENMNNLGPNEEGELFIKGPNIMKGYKNNPEANKEVFDRDWFKSGDMAKIDETGSVMISDRLKDLIKVKSLQVAPAELESVIKEHPAVFDAAVIGVPDPITGERPRAFVILHANAKAKDEDLIDFVSKRVAPYKIIKEITFVDNIPKNPSGKILRRLLKSQFCT